MVGLLQIGGRGHIENASLDEQPNETSQSWPWLCMFFDQVFFTVCEAENPPKKLTFVVPTPSDKEFQAHYLGCHV